ncbi:hypothetical protein [Aureimonas mangrovi]|uniref:hypothetical protein n=1 Tax=Aureimonas mangrovi TaxID=2758041 RepID=UPI00163DD56C|nr:hypothetical protein [Aureimonas mangrovi]
MSEVNSVTDVWVTILGGGKCQTCPIAQGLAGHAMRLAEITAPTTDEFELLALSACRGCVDEVEVEEIDPGVWDIDLWPAREAYRPLEVIHPAG